MVSSIEPIILIEIYSVFNRLDTDYICIFEGMYEENIIQCILCGYVEPKNKQEFLGIFLKLWTNYENMKVFHP